MGTGIARHMESNNLEVTLLDKNESQLTTAREALSLPGVTTTTDFNVLSSADYVIEAVFEDISVKQEVLADIAKHTRPSS